MSITLPLYNRNERQSCATLLTGLLDHDQYDDWLPDAMYYLDAKRTQDEVSRMMEAKFDTSPAVSLADFPTLRLGIPRANGSELQSLTLPFEHRLCNHVVIGAMCRRLLAKASPAKPPLRVDKVFGFFYAEGRTPSFSTPGEELEEALMNAIVACEDTLSVHDIVRFNANAKLDRLLKTLSGLGARADDEIRFLKSLLTLADGSFPSVDDAVACLYNFYLRDVDESLFAKATNFLRYRDEYFLFHEKSADGLKKALAQLSLEAREVTRKKLSEFKSTLQDEAVKSAKKMDGDSGSGSVGESVLGAIDVVCTGLGWDGSDFTDGWEWECSFRRPDMSVQNLLALAGEDAPDGVRLLPLLREFHRVRSEAVLLVPPFEHGSDTFLAYAGAIRLQAENFLDIIAKGVARKRFWLISWAARMLSDSPALDPVQIAGLRSVLHEPSIPEAIRWELRLALARHGELDPYKDWKSPTVRDHPWVIRAALLCAHYCREKNRSLPVGSVPKETLATEVRLTAFLKLK